MECEWQDRRCAAVDVTLEVDNDDVGNDGVERVGAKRGGVGRGRGDRDLEEPWCCDGSGRENMIQHAAQWWPELVDIEVLVSYWGPLTADVDNLTEMFEGSSMARRTD